MNPTSRSTLDLADQVLHDLESADYKLELATAVARTSEEASHRLVLAKALYGYYRTWTQNRASAITAVAWQRISARLTELVKRLTSRRQAALEGQIDETIGELFSDAGLNVSSLKVQKTQADLRLVDSSGRELELRMLSAGQRNAVLLAPALAVASGGPFGFLVVDDPIHSFDQLRVDKVARQLIKIAGQRRVIVFTHDERLREHLLAASDQVDSRSIRRRADSGRIEVWATEPMWSTLLNDARSLLLLANSPPEELALTNTVRGLCRQAIDNCLRRVVTREAVVVGVDPSDWLGRLDGRQVATTAQRLTEAKVLLPSGAAQRVAAAEALLAPYLRGWNEASHGNPPLVAVTDSEINSARSACKGMVRD